MRTHKFRGFTLIELLVVIAIIGILASVVLASLNTARAKARDARRESDMKQIASALELYANDHGGSYVSQTTQGGVPAGLATQYIPSIPTDPTGTQAYQYISDSTGTHYCVGAKLEGVVPTPASTCTAALLSNVVNYSIGQ